MQYLNQPHHLPQHNIIHNEQQPLYINCMKESCSVPAIFTLLLLLLHNQRHTSPRSLWHSTTCTSVYSRAYLHEGVLQHASNGLPQLRDALHSHSHCHSTTSTIANSIITCMKESCSMSQWPASAQACFTMQHATDSCSCICCNQIKKQGLPA